MVHPLPDSMAGRTSLQLDETEAERLINLLTDGLVNIDDKDGTFTYTSQYCTIRVRLI